VGGVQKLITGAGSINLLSSELLAVNKKEVFLISGLHFQKKINEGLLSEFKVEHYIKTAGYVTEEEIVSAFQKFSGNTNQALVAIGGGSVIDLAKAIIYRCVQSELPVPYLIAAPTTTGSGSEATHFAVIYKKNKKYSMVNPLLLPVVVILDPELTVSLSPYQSAVSGMDVLAQAVESYWNKNATLDSKKYAVESISIWKKYFLLSVNNPDLQARSEMQKAAYLAGKAINITRTTGPHALSYYLTAHFQIPHGQAVALFLPLFFIYNNPGNELLSLLDVHTVLGAKEFIQDIMKKTGLACSFGELGLNKELIIDDLLNDVNQERFENNPVQFDREHLKKLILEYL